MSESTYTQLVKLKTSIYAIAQQEVPVLQSCPAYSLFKIRKEIAIRILRDELSSQEEEMLVELLDSYNSTIKQYLGL
jgi:hypothetical protein